jgi:hypothetical protein
LSLILDLVGCAALTLGAFAIWPPLALFVFGAWRSSRRGGCRREHLLRAAASPARWTGGAKGFDAPPSGRVVTPESATYLVPVYAAIRHIVDYGSTSDLDAYRDNGDGTRAEVALPQFLRAQDGLGKAGAGAVHRPGPLRDRGARERWWGGRPPSTPTATPRRRVAQPQPVVLQPGVEAVAGRRRARRLLQHRPHPVDRPTRLRPRALADRALPGRDRLGSVAQEYADLRRGGGVPPSVLKNNARTLTPDEADVMKRRAAASFAEGLPFVTGSDWDFNMVAIPPNQAQFIETMKMSANQVAAIYGLESREVGGEVTVVRHAEVRQRRVAGAEPGHEHAALPGALSDAFSRLMPLKQYVGFDLNAAIRTDTKTRFEIYQIERALGTMSVNEIRAAEDRPPVPGGDSYTPAATPAPGSAPPNTPAGPANTMMQGEPT